MARVLCSLLMDIHTWIQNKPLWNSLSSLFVLLGRWKGWKIWNVHVFWKFLKIFDPSEEFLTSFWVLKTHFSGWTNLDSNRNFWFRVRKPECSYSGAEVNVRKLSSFQSRFELNHVSYARSTLFYGFPLLPQVLNDLYWN